MVEILIGKGNKTLQKLEKDAHKPIINIQNILYIEQLKIIFHARRESPLKRVNKGYGTLYLPNLIDIERV